jgi:LacI family transcriptional regulator, galactose operon repressor
MPTLPWARGHHSELAIAETGDKYGPELIMAREEERLGTAMRPATLAEVARLAGVSTATVARVIKSSGYVSSEARGRVEAAISAKCYRPNAIARGLRQRRSFTVGHILTSITINPFFVNVAHWAEEEALKHGYKTFLFNHNGSRERERLGIEQFIERRVDAVLFTNARAEENLKLLSEANIPAIQLERVATVTAPSLRVDNKVGAIEAMRHFFTLGHRRIAFIGGDPNLNHRADESVEHERLTAYRSAIREAGLRVDPEFVKLGHYYRIEEGGTGIEGYRHARVVLALRNRPTAIFATCDILAAGVLQAIYDAGLRVPDDISVIGFDDTIGVYLTPQLTTVAQPMEELGRLGFQMALAAIEGQPNPSPGPLKSRLVIRHSTGSAPRAGR